MFTFAMNAMNNRLSNTIAQYSTNFGIFFASEYVKLIH